jgi:hypothetical protein
VYAESDGRVLGENRAQIIPNARDLGFRSETRRIGQHRGIDMSLVRRINESGKGCGVVLNESAMKNRLYCGMKSSLSFQGQDKYHLCEDCFLMFKLSQEIQTK